MLYDDVVVIGRRSKEIKNQDKFHFVSLHFLKFFFFFFSQFISFHFPSLPLLSSLLHLIPSHFPPLSENPILAGTTHHTTPLPTSRYKNLIDKHVFLSLFVRSFNAHNHVHDYDDDDDHEDEVDRHACIYLGIYFSQTDIYTYT